jgi:hypothetical protein
MGLLVQFRAIVQIMHYERTTLMFKTSLIAVAAILALSSGAMAERATYAGNQGATKAFADKATNGGDKGDAGRSGGENGGSGRSHQ